MKSKDIKRSEYVNKNKLKFPKKSDVIIGEDYTKLKKKYLKEQSDLKKLHLADLKLRNELTVAAAS